MSPEQRMEFIQKVQEVHKGWMPISSEDWHLLALFRNWGKPQLNDNDRKAHYFVTELGEICHVNDEQLYGYYETDIQQLTQQKDEKK